MSEPRESPDPAARSAETGPEEMPESGDFRNLPQLPEQEGADTPTGGVNLFIAYGLIAFALVAAMAVAALIVWPYYKAR